MDTTELQDEIWTPHKYSNGTKLGTTRYTNTGIDEQVCVLSNDICIGQKGHMIN